MAARRYEICLRVLKYFFNTGFFAAKGTIYYMTIATVIFSRVRITCYFHVWRYHVFARKLTWYFIGVYIIKLNMIFTVLVWFYLLTNSLEWDVVLFRAVLAEPGEEDLEVAGVIRFEIVLSCIFHYVSSLSNLKRRYRAIGIGESLTFILMTRPPVIVELPCSCILYGRTYTAHMSVIRHWTWTTLLFLFLLMKLG